MRLHELKSISKKAKRIGRGGKRGTTSGRGTKGQKSRSGHVIRPAERDLLLKLPKKRGFRNKPKSDQAYVFNVGDLQKAFVGRSAEGKVVLSRDIFRDAGLLQKGFHGVIKILGEGSIRFPVSIPSEIEVSKSAEVKITKAGGTVAKA